MFGSLAPVRAQSDERAWAYPDEPVVDYQCHPSFTPLVCQRQKEARTCGGGVLLDPYVVWRNVKEREDVAPFVRSAYKRIGSIEGLANWLRCQGFFAFVSSGPARQYMEAGEKQIGSIFTTCHYEKGCSPTLWGSYWFWQPAAQRVDITFDPKGNIRAIGASDDYK